MARPAALPGLLALPALLAVSVAAAAGLSAAARGPPADDALAALQVSAEVSSGLDAAAENLLRRLSNKADPAANELDSSGFNCSAMPEFCTEPFNCDRPAAEKQSVARVDGRPDYQQWCRGPYKEAVLKCVRGDLPGYARLMHKAQLDLPLASMIETIDAHYCFGMGHCHNTAVTPETTLAEAEAMCDSRFGTEWRTISHKQLDFNLKSLKPTPLGPSFDNKTENAFAELACAMGNYHCEVVYCRQEYCHQEALVAAFGKLSPL